MAQQVAAKSFVLSVEKITNEAIRALEQPFRVDYIRRGKRVNIAMTLDILRAYLSMRDVSETGEHRRALSEAASVLRGPTVGLKHDWRMHVIDTVRRVLEAVTAWEAAHGLVPVVDVLHYRKNMK